MLFREIGRIKKESKMWTYIFQSNFISLQVIDSAWAWHEKMPKITFFAEYLSCWIWQKKRPMFFLAQMLHRDQYSKALAWPDQWKLELVPDEFRETLRACLYGQPFCRKRNILVDICKIRLLVEKFSVDMLQKKAYQNLHFSNSFWGFLFPAGQGSDALFFLWTLSLWVTWL